MALSWQPLTYWPYVVMVLALTAVLTHLLGYKKLGAKRGVRVLIVALTGLTAVLLTIAAFNPILTAETSPPKLHFVVLVDVSDSVLRDRDRFLQMQQDVARLLTATIAQATEERLANATASLITFGDGIAPVERNIPLRDLPNTFTRLSPADFAAGNATNIERALKDAERNIQQAGNQGAILLISDGNGTIGDAAKMAKRLGQQTIPVYVYPLTSPPPGIGIASTYLPERIDGRLPANLRLILQNQSEQPVNTQLTIEQNSGLLTENTVFGMPLISPPQEYSISGTDTRWAIQPLSFEGIGLQFVDVILIPETGSVEHRRRLFTHITRPVHVLAIGGDNRWTEALSPDTTTVTPISPSELTPAYDLKEVDVVAISGVPAGEFPAGALQMLADANTEQGMGIFLINGDHAGADIEEDPTVLMTYENTPLENLLPLTTDKRIFYELPPLRNVVILIDRSGSMSGNNLQLAKQVTIYITQNLLRDSDYLDVIAFDDRAHPIVTNLTMNDAGKREAVNGINSISIGGGTYPGAALASIQERQLTQCGLIFISDGEFAASEVSQRPECQATTFVIGHASVPANAPIRLLADPFPVTTGFNPANITIPYFEPEERKKNFEPGEYVPRADSYSGQQVYALPVPDLPLEGNAISVLTYTESAIQIAVRPRFADPILAYQENENGYAGVFATAFPEAWLLDENGREAIDAWIKRTVPYLARDRYDFQIEEQGNTLLLQISIVAQNGIIPDVQSISAMLEMDDGGQEAGAFTAVEGIPGLFRGEIHLPERSNAAQPAYLVVTEGSGADALPRNQRIPFLIPPASVQTSKSRLDEAYTHGLNADLLQTIVAASRGEYNPEDTFSLFRSQSAQPPTTPLWPFFAVAATISYLSAIALRRLNP